MNGAELREALRHEMAAVVPPPPLDSAAALGTARRVRARRRTGWACAGSAAVVLAVAGGAAIGTAGAGIPGTGGVGPAAAGPRPIPGPSGKTAEPWPTGPDGRPQEDRTAKAGARYDQAVRLLDQLISVVPAGYAVPENPAGGSDDPPRSSQASFEEKVNGVDVWRYTSAAAVARGDRTGRVLVEVYTRGNRLPTEPCALTREFWGMQGQCQVVTVGATKVGVVVRPTTDRRFEQWSAYRHPDGVVTFVAQAPTFGSPRQGLAELPFTVPQLATLAMDERFHLQ
ncbi:MULTISPECIES: hypothetical protein [Micromonospora]|uniref:Uncharacterized protein n=1 Tax=Micromonospora solifontis TaxID=2487138 RepID=A0ABX9WFA1_9ACTN|nr:MULTISPECIES: hypothetical protein [Micromonospora]NES13863.1 hypothetical protein [Micromonospora sp. PPF5-17B]NES37932.1 hypothetical protein [Micromonospora solifontis]NES53963.1 hypothetical protein [Micromonospora sp. PPF5-6]RNL97781.1 hypothetical protein EFE23_17505 [Micromonospora solifontis]